MRLTAFEPFVMLKEVSTTAFMLILIWPMLIACAQTEKSREESNEISNTQLGYNLTEPDYQYQLPYDLEEISGLSYFKDSIIVSVQDEAGKLFFYDYNQGKLLDDFRFGPDGDYEGVEVVDSVIYVVKSNGTLYAIHTSTKEVTKMKTGLSIKNDVEGLAYDRANKQLILACKGESLSKSSGKSFYAFKLSKSAKVDKPIFKISKKQIKKFLKTEGIEKAVKEFKPSGIAVHPITGELFVLAHRGKWLLKLNQSYELIGVASLNNKLFRQPEGICFTPAGDLLISNEGQGDRGSLLYYKYQVSK